MKKENESPVWLPIGRFVAHPQNPRLYWRDETITSIMKQIVIHGFLPRYALIARPLTDTTFQIISGHHRHVAGIRSGLDELPAWITQMDDEDAYIELVLSNTQSELSLLEIAVHVASRMESRNIAGEDDERIADLARRLNKTRQRLYQLAKAGQVFLHYQSTSNQFDTSDIQLLEGKVKHLTAISDNNAPKEHWNGLVQLILTNKKMTADDVCLAIDACKQKTMFDADYMNEVVLTAQRERDAEPTTLVELLNKMSRQKLVQLCLNFAERLNLGMQEVKNVLAVIRGEVSE